MAEGTNKNYWIARMTIHDTESIQDTWQWPEAIENNIYLTWFDYEEIAESAHKRIEAFLNKVKDVKIGDVLLLTYHSVIYAYGEVDNPPESNQITTTEKTIANRGNREYKDGIVLYEDAEAFFENMGYDPHLRFSNCADDERWRQQIKVKSWNFFENSKVSTKGIKKTKKEMEDYDSIYRPLHKVSEWFAEEKIKCLLRYK